MIDEYLDASDEAALSDELNRIRMAEAVRKSSYACHIHLGKGPWFAHHRDVFDELCLAVSQFVFQNQGRFYKLHNFDLCLTLRIENARLVDRMIYRLLPILHKFAPQLGMNEAQMQQATTWYNLGDDLDKLAEKITEFSAALEEFSEKRRRLLKKSGGKGVTEAKATLDSQMLAEIEKSLARANLDSFIRNQPICACKSGSLPVPVFREVYISIEHLQRQLAPAIDLVSGRALFHHLMRSLDQRMLRAIMAGHIGTEFGPFSINLTAHTILSPVFREFDERVNQIAKKNQIIIEIQPYDVFWDFTEIKIACEFLRSNGYRVLLDAISPNVLPLYIAMDLGADFIKMFVLKHEIPDWQNPELMRLITRNSGIVILGHCSTDYELQIGGQAGIELFQGRTIDDAIKNRQPVNLLQ